jgi:hypothetical protein
MKNILAENMLRFGVKNLSNKSKHVLSEKAKLDEVEPEQPSAVTNITSQLTQWNSNIPKFLDDSASADDMSKPNILVDPSKNIILYYEYTTAAAAAAKSSYPGSGKLSVYKLRADGGIPYIINLGTFINNFGSGWKKSPKDTITKVDQNSLIAGTLKSFNQKDVATRFIDIWEKPLDPLIKNAAIQLIQTNSQQYIAEYQKITRSPDHLKMWWAPTAELAKPWKNDNPNKLEASHYYTSVVNKLQKYPDARQVLNIINDIGLRNWIQYKVDNWKSDGEYPELVNRMPSPVIV